MTNARRETTVRGPKFSLEMRGFHACKMLTFPCVYRRLAITKPAVYRGSLHCTAKPNMFSKAEKESLCPTSSLLTTPARLRLRAACHRCRAVERAEIGGGNFAA